MLPDWKGILTPRYGASAPAVMNVNFDGQTYSFEVKPGPDGYRRFTDAIRRAFTLPEDSELNITFTCDEPGIGARAPRALHYSSPRASSPPLQKRARPPPHHSPARAGCVLLPPSSPPLRMGSSRRPPTSMVQC